MISRVEWTTRGDVDVLLWLGFRWYLHPPGEREVVSVRSFGSGEKRGDRTE